MHRRSVLTTLGSAASLSIAGCSRLGSLRSPSTDRRVVRLVDADGVPAAYEVLVTVEILDPAITPDGTARLRISTTNTGRRRALSVSPGKCSLFNRTRGGSDHPPGLWLHRAGSTSHIERDGDRWVADRPPDDPRVYPDYGCLATVYETGDTVTNEYEVWHDYQVSGYMNPGTYRWEERIRIYDAADGHAGDDQVGSFHWGFELEVAVPEDE